MRKRRPRRTAPSASVLIVFLLVLAAAGWTATAPALETKNRLSVRAQLWRTHLRLEITFHVPPPAGTCTGTAEERALDPLCTEQYGVLHVQVRKNHRLLYDEIPRDVSTVGYHEQRIRFVQIQAETGRCLPGRYDWTVILHDGWGRTSLNTSRRGHIILHCAGPPGRQQLVGR